MAHICLRDVTVSFPIFTQHTRSIKTAVLSKIGGSLSAHNDTIIVQALRNVSLELRDGDRLGVVGHNGAGKTTFLRVISGVYPPRSGEAIIEGKVSSFTDITLGMDPEATGWQNIIFRSVFLGSTFAEAQALAPSIGKFSELGEYLDLPVRTYSTGMFVRLAFAISTAVQPDIVVMDEMIGAGDQSFIEKARTRVAELLDRAPILVLASHNDPIIRSFCNKVLWLEKGLIKMLGPVDEVMAEYCQPAAVVLAAHAAPVNLLRNKAETGGVGTPAETEE
jgi:ABC-type polysaccharide/polyol phosphate transport system ATPase subunit